MQKLQEFLYNFSGSKIFEQTNKHPINKLTIIIQMSVLILGCTSYALLYLLEGVLDLADCCEGVLLHQGSKSSVIHRSCLPRSLGTFGVPDLTWVYLDTTEIASSKCNMNLHMSH